MRNIFRKIKTVSVTVWNLIIKNIRTIIVWGVLYYFFPTFITVVFFLLGIPLAIIVVSAVQALKFYEKVIIKERLTIQEAYKRRFEFADKIKFNKLARIILISTIEGEYNKEVVTTKDNVELARQDLGLPKVFNEQDVKKAWKDLLKVNHPDLVEEHLKINANKRTIEINQAKDTLMTYLKDNGVLSKFTFK